MVLALSMSSNVDWYWLMLIDIYMKFLDILNRFQVTERTRFYDGHSSKGNNSKRINARVMVLMFCMYDNVDCYQYEVSWRQLEPFSSYRADMNFTDRQTPREKTMHISPYPKGGRHQYKIPSSSGRGHIAFADLVATGVPIQRRQYLE